MEHEEGINYLKNEFNLSDIDAENLYYEVKALTGDRDTNDWIAPWPGYASGVDDCNKKGNVIECPFAEGTIYIDLTTMDAEIPTQQESLKPSLIVYPTATDIAVKEFNGTINLGVTLIPKDNQNSYSIVISSPEIATSMFNRMFYLKGHGLEHFKLFSYERSIFGNEIYVWNVSWGGSNKNIVLEFLPKAEVEEAVKVISNATDSNLSEE